MSTDQQWREQVRRDAIAAGWAPEVAQFLAANVGKKTGPSLTGRTSARAVVGKAPAALSEQRAIADTVRLVGLPASVAGELRAAGITTLARVREMLRPFINPRASATPLRLQLLAMARRRGASA